MAIAENINMQNSTTAKSRRYSILNIFHSGQQFHPSVTCVKVKGLECTEVNVFLALQTFKTGFFILTELDTD